MFSPDGTLISASAAPHCGGRGRGGERERERERAMVGRVVIIGVKYPLDQAILLARGRGPAANIGLYRPAGEY